MWPSIDLMMYVLGGFLAAWGASLIVRTRATRRVARGRCAECSRIWAEGEHTCQRCGAERASQAAAVVRRPAIWGLVGTAVVVGGFSCPWWGLPLIGWLTGTSGVIGSGLGLIAAVAFVAGTFGVSTIVAGLWGDPARGRSRCRRCWYPMEQAVPATCPECGTQATVQGDLFRTRRHRGLILAGAALIALAQVGWLDSYLQRGGLVSLVPTGVLISGMGWMPDEWIAGDRYSAAARAFAPDGSLRGRVRDAQLTPTQLQQVRRGALRLIGPGTTPDRADQLLDLIREASSPVASGAAPGAYSSWQQYAVYQQPSFAGAGSLATSPELDRGHAAALAPMLRAMSVKGAPRQVALAWLVEELARVRSYEDNSPLASDAFVQQVVAQRAALRALASSTSDDVAAAALLLLAIADQSEPGDVRRLQGLVGSTSPVAPTLAQSALGALALDDGAALGWWSADSPSPWNARTASLLAEVDLLRSPAASGSRPARLVRWDVVDDEAVRQAGAALRAGSRPVLAPALIPMLAGRFMPPETLVIALSRAARHDEGVKDQIVRAILVTPDDPELWTALERAGDPTEQEIIALLPLLSLDQAIFGQSNVLAWLAVWAESDPDSARSHLPRLVDYRASLGRVRGNQGYIYGDHERRALVSRVIDLLGPVPEDPSAALLPADTSPTGPPPPGEP